MVKFTYYCQKSIKSMYHLWIYLSNIYRCIFIIISSQKISQFQIAAGRENVGAWRVHWPEATSEKDRHFWMNELSLAWNESLSLLATTRAWVDTTTGTMHTGESLHARRDAEAFVSVDTRREQKSFVDSADETLPTADFANRGDVFSRANSRWKLARNVSGCQREKRNLRDF